jgi:hypothetical protein
MVGPFVLRTRRCVEEIYLKDIIHTSDEILVELNRLCGEPPPSNENWLSSPTTPAKKDTDSISPTTNGIGYLAYKSTKGQGIITHTQSTFSTSSKRADNMKHLIVVGACYLDTILKNVTLVYTLMVSTNLPLVSRSSHPRTPNYVPPASISDVGVTAPTHCKYWNSWLATMMPSNCI